jgi:hypothetical protein
MKTRLLAIVLLAATVGIASCRSTGQPPGPSPEPGPGAGTTAPPNPNPNPIPPQPAPGPTPIASHGAAPSLAAAVPDQPASPASATTGARPHEDLVRLKRAGASDENLLEKVRTDGVNYHLTTADVVELKAAGFSEAVLQAMLRSGQAAPSR